MSRNVEFQSLFHQLANGAVASAIVPLAMTAATAIAVALTPRREDLALIAIAGLMICAWCFAMRNMAFAVIACASPLARHLSLCIASARGGVEWERPKRIARAPAPLALLALAAAAFLGVSAKILSDSLPTFVEFPAGAVAFMERNHLSGNILSTYPWSGYLIWHMAPASKVFFDSFDERYPPSVQYDYLRVMSGGASAALVLEGYPHDYVLAPASSSLFDLMVKHGGWVPIYQDSVSALFARGAAATSHPPVTGSAPSTKFP